MMTTRTETHSQQSPVDGAALSHGTPLILPPRDQKPAELDKSHDTVYHGCPCATDPGLRIRREAMCPLLGRGFHNLTCSRLASLPEELLVKIMVELAAVNSQIHSLLQLRQTSRLFLRLFESEAFHSWHYGSSLPQNPNTRLPWRIPSPCMPGTSLGVVSDLQPLAKVIYPAAWLPRLPRRRREGACQVCTLAQDDEASDEQTPVRLSQLTECLLYCSSCHVFHPSCLFSARQRAQADSEQRVCTAHEGAVRLCQHRSVPLHEIMAVVSRRLQHCYRERKNSQSVECVAVCHHASHQPHHKMEKHVRRGRREREKEKTRDEMFPPDSPPETEPALYVAFDAIHHKVSLIMTWTGHLALKKEDVQVVSMDSIDDSDSDESDSDDKTSDSATADDFIFCPNLTHDELGTRIQKLRQGAGEYIVPPLPQGRLLEMMVVDPTRCSCLRLPGSEFVSSGYRMPMSDCEFAHKKCQTGTSTSSLWGHFSSDTEDCAPECDSECDSDSDSHSDSDSNSDSDSDSDFDTRSFSSESSVDSQATTSTVSMSACMEKYLCRALADDGNNMILDRGALEGPNHRAEHRRCDAMSMSSPSFYDSVSVTMRACQSCPTEPAPCSPSAPPQPTCIEVLYHTRIQVCTLHASSIPLDPSDQQVNNDTDSTRQTSCFLRNRTKLVPSLPLLPWYMALDPDSYHADEDRLGHGLSWCRTPACRNYYRGIRRPFVDRYCMHWQDSKDGMTAVSLV